MTLICVDREGKQRGEVHIQQAKDLRPLCGASTRGKWQQMLPGTEPTCNACKMVANYVAPGDQIVMAL